MKLDLERYCPVEAKFAVGVVWNMTDLRGPWEELCRAGWEAERHVAQGEGSVEAEKLTDSLRLSG